MPGFGSWTRRGRHPTVIAAGMFATLLLLSCSTRKVQPQPTSAAAAVEETVLTKPVDRPLMTLEAVPVYFGSEPFTALCLVLEQPAGERILYFVHPERKAEIGKLVGLRLRVVGYLDTASADFLEARKFDGTFLPLSWEVLY